MATTNLPAKNKNQKTASKSNGLLNGITNITKTDPKLDITICDKLVTARIGLLIRAPFFGNMGTRLELVNADEWCETAATDGRKLYYNTNFINMLSLKECEFLIAHEILHNCYMHMDRCGQRDKKIHNIACDYVVTADLIDQRIGEKITSVPILFDPKYKGMSSEEVYDLLINDAEKNTDQLIQQLLDEHMDGDDGCDSEDGKDGKGRPVLSAAEKKQIRDEVREAMINAAQSVGAGNTPAGVRRMLKDLCEPKMNWREMLQQQIESLVKSDCSWLRPSRRSWHCDAIMPGRLPDQTIDIAIAIDTSGSISNSMLTEFLSEVKGIMDSYNDYKITLWTFDTAVHNMKEFTQDNGSELLEYELHGGGGTLFEANWTFMSNNDIKPQKFIMMTDGEPGHGWGDANYCDTVWIIHGSDKVAPFGVSVRYDESKK